MNLSIISGNVGRDPALRSTNSGRSVLNLDVAVDNYFTRTQSDGTRVQDSDTHWFPVVVWGRQAELAAQNIRQGTRITVQGTLRTRTYEDRDGISHKSFELHADRVEWPARAGAQTTIPTTSPNTSV